MSNGYHCHLTFEHVLVTGGAGYIGSVLVPLLLEKGYEVTVYDAFKYGVTSLLSVSSNPKLHLIRGDICDKSLLEPVMQAVDAVIHLAAVVGYPACDADPEEAKRVNITGTEVIASLIDSQRHKTVYASTGSCYGRLESLCTEETPICPLSLYGESKAKGEDILLEVNAVVLRLATLFGLSPRPRFDLLINSLTEEAIKKKHISIYEADFKRTFLHVKDAARAFIFALENFTVMSRNVFNVGDEGMNMTKGEAVFKIQSFLPETVINLSNEGEDKDKRDYHVSYSKISKLGFSSRFTLEEGIQELIKILPTMNSREIEFYRNL